MKAQLSGALPAFAFCIFATLVSFADTAFVTFDNCLEDSVTESQPPLLQFTPYFVNAAFDSSHTLNLTIYGNVSGQQFRGDYPPPDDPHWTDNSSSADLGKITNLGSANEYTTLIALYEVVTFTAYDNKGEQFCKSLDNNTLLGNNNSCPLGPAFYANRSDPSQLPSFSLSRPLGSSYSFSTISTDVRILSGDTVAQNIGCISVQVTPDLSSKITGLLTWLPAAILVFKGAATLLAAICSPWGSSDIFRWSSNYGRDEDLLRLVTPGFGDCLQYIQFVVLTGSLTLQYPGFFQPAVSQASWSCLLFNESFVSHGHGTQSLVDGLYTANATYGLSQMSQLIGMTAGKDIWACMAIWLLVIAGIVIVACQLGFLGRWIHRKVTKTAEEDLRRKNLPFTLGNMNRLLLNYFILPIVSLSLFQLVISSRSPTSVVVCAVILLLIMIVAAAWILRVIFVTKPRTLLFDDMPVVLLYGPLYNTYSDSAAPFALVPTGLTFMRGVAIGAVQPSGIAQIIILAICEVVLLLVINALRPFHGQTSMNIYHTVFSSVRVITILLMVAFVPSLGVTEASKGWIGYVILILHAFVLVFGFFFNALQTVIEVVARFLGAGGDAQSGAVRGSILSLRMLQRRRNRRDPGDRGSMTSNAAILRAENEDERSANYGGRSRSLSASSHNLLNNRTSGIDQLTAGDLHSSIEEPRSVTAASVANGGARNDGDNYYRPPRPRKATLDALNAPGTRTRSGSDFPYLDEPELSPIHARKISYDNQVGHDSPAPAYIRDRADSADQTSPRTDYAVREVDQYYRGPALNDQPTRRLKTGPADPEGPASTAQSWFQRMVVGVTGAKKKDQSKGFEVVRSARAPPGNADEVEMQTSPAMHQEPYHDSPPIAQGEMQAVSGADRPVSPLDDVEQPRFGATQGFNFGFDGASDATAHDGGAPPRAALNPNKSVKSNRSGHSGKVSPLFERNNRFSTDTASNYDRASSHYPDGDSVRDFRMSEAPTLGPVDLDGGFDVPSRFNSTASRGKLSRKPSGRSDDMAAEWLRAVDSLAWDHNRQTPAGGPEVNPRPGQQVFRAPPPSLPRRSSQRMSQRFQPQGNDLFEGFESGPGPRSPNLLGMASPHDDRPSSYTNVSHHRAADSISRNSIGATAAMQASQAEYFSGSLPKHEGGFI